MTMRLLPAFLLVAACGGAPKPAPDPAPNPVPVAAACASPEHRQLDFWIGEWDLVVTSGGNTERATQHVTSILGGCAISEDFASDGGTSGTPWAGRSYSTWQPALGKWRQTWVDDQGSYLAFVGGLEDGVMTLYGEPTVKDAQPVEMRMVFLDVKADSLRWEWQRKGADGTWAAQMVIEYTRRR